LVQAVLFWKAREIGMGKLYGKVAVVTGAARAIVQTAMLAEAPYTMLRDAALVQPTMTEGFKSLFAGIPAQAEECAGRPEPAHARA
jgi:hypothetical protein